MWILQDAKNRFSAAVDAAMKGVPQEVSRRGKPAVVVLSAVKYHRLRAQAWAERDNPAFAADLRVWLDRTAALFADRILPFGIEEARVWGRLSARTGHGAADLMIAACALVRDAMIVTRNGPDFAPTGVRIEDPV